MSQGVWGVKVGMTQMFHHDAALPVTVVALSDWYVVGLKTVDRDGYAAIKVGYPRLRYRAMPLSLTWLKQLKNYFLHVREVRILENDANKYVVGSKFAATQVLTEGERVAVGGVSKGRGFSGVMKRHNFGGGPRSHGSMFSRRPGAISFMRSRGRVIKGKRLPGHFGAAHKTIGSSVLKIDVNQGVCLLLGGIPGAVGSLVSVRKI